MSSYASVTTGIGAALHESDQPPRVGVVVTQLGYGGAEKQIFELLRMLKGTPWQPVGVYCLSSHVHPYGPGLEALGYRLVVIPRQSSYDPRRLLMLRRALESDGVTLVHGVHLLASAYAWLATRGPNPVPVLPTMRATTVRPGRLRSAVYRRMFASCRRILANSYSGAQFLTSEMGADRHRIVVVPNGLHFDDIRRQLSTRRLRAELGVSEHTPIVGFVGKDSRVKNVPRFLDVVQKLRAVRPDLHAVLIGHGLGEGARASLAPNLPLAVHFLGTRDDAPALIAEMNALVVTSDSEGCPNVVLEAMAVATPVVSADVGDVARMIPPGAGHTVPAADIDGYVNVLRLLLESPEAARIAVRATWPALERGYSVQSMVQRTVNQWQILLRQQGTNHRSSG